MEALTNPVFAELVTKGCLAIFFHAIFMFLISQIRRY
jgi:hypothetical protein